MTLVKTKRENFEAEALPQLESLYRTALYLLNDETGAQNLVRNSFVAAYRSWNDCPFSPDCRVRLFGIMADVLDRQYKPVPDLPAGTNDNDEIDESMVSSPADNRLSMGDCEAVPFSAISEAAVRTAIGGLSHDLRLIVVLSMLEGFSYLEIANISGIEYKIVRDLIHQGRRIVQKELFDLVGSEA
jgi:RNA polymerase sigma-70 factor (ECF subfamily)